MARIKAEGPRKKSEDEELPFGLDKPKETEEAEEEENGGLNELGALTAETSAGGNNYDYD